MRSHCMSDPTATKWLHGRPWPLLFEWPESSAEVRRLQLHPRSPARPIRRFAANQDVPATISAGGPPEAT